MESKSSVPASMVVCGKTFNLAGLVNEGALALQMANIFNVLKHQATATETQSLQIEAIQKKLLEIDTLNAKLSSVQAGQENNVRRLNTLEERQQTDRREAEKLRDRIGEVELNIRKVDAMEKRVAEQDKTLHQVQSDFEQLKVDARDALTLSSTVNFFKTELMELQEDVTKVLHQAPQTERLMAQVQHNVEASTDQLLTVSSKTAFMEAAISKISVQVDEFKHLRVDLVNRLNLLENPKVDRLGGLEQQSRALSKQVQVLQHNWMSNWGAHEQSMTMLREELMLHIDQLRRKLESVGGGTGGATQTQDGQLTFIRMDEEEKAMFRKTLDQHQRDLSRLDNKKADAQLVIKILHDKADYPALDKKLDLVTFQEKWDELQSLLNTVNIALDSSVQQAPTNGASVSQGEDATNEQLARSLEESRPPSSGAETPSTVPAQSTTPGAMSKQPSASRLSSSTPPPAKVSKSVRYTSSSSSAAPSANPAASVVAQRRLLTSKSHGMALSKAPLQQVTPTTNWTTAPPGKIRPSTATPSLPGNPAVYLLGSASSTQPRQAPPPDLQLTAVSIKSNAEDGPSPMRPASSGGFGASGRMFES